MEKLLSKLAALLTAVLNKLEKGVPITGGGDMSIEVPPVNVQVEATKSLNDFALAKFENTDTYMYLAKTNGNTAKCIIIRIHSDLSQIGYALGAIGSLETLWTDRGTISYANSVVL